METIPTAAGRRRRVVVLGSTGSIGGNCLDVIADSKATPLLMWRGPRDTIPPGAGRLGIETVFAVYVRRVDVLVTTHGL